MKRKAVTILVFASMVFADNSALDTTDSLTVRSILDQVGWISVPVDSVTRPDLITDLRNPRITQLDLSYRPGLPAITSLPPQVNKLPELAYLSVSGNQLSDLPQEIGSLYKLIRLDLSDNNFTSLPQSATGLISVTLLDMSGNRLETFPQGVTGMNLRILDLHRNFITEIPAEITRMNALKSLFLNSNRIEELSIEVSRMVNLEILRLDSNLLYMLPAGITGLQNLQISIAGNAICTTDSLLANWLDLHHLSLDWRASQICAESDYSVVMREPVTGSTVVLHSSTQMEKSSLDQIQALYVKDTIISTVQPGKEILKAIAVSVNTILDRETNVFTVAFPVETGLPLPLLSIYYIDSSGQLEFIGSSYSTSSGLISARTTRTGVYALVMNTFSAPVRKISQSADPMIKYSARNSRLDAAVSLRSPSPLQIRIYSPDGKLVSALMNRTVPAGTHRFSFSCQNLSRAAYILQLKVFSEVFSFPFTNFR